MYPLQFRNNEFGTSYLALRRIMNLSANFFPFSCAKEKAIVVKFWFDFWKTPHVGPEFS